MENSENTFEKKWYAIRTITGHEKRVKSFLESEIPIANLQNKISQVLIPEEKVFELKGGKKKVKFKNFFPGYVLVEALLDYARAHDYQQISVDAQPHYVPFYRNNGFVEQGETFIDGGVQRIKMAMKLLPR